MYVCILGAKGIEEKIRVRETERESRTRHPGGWPAVDRYIQELTADITQENGTFPQSLAQLSLPLSVLFIIYFYKRQKGLAQSFVKSMAMP